MKALLLLPLLGLAGCAALNVDRAFPNPECRKVMYDDPKVKQAIGIDAFARQPVIGGADDNDVAVIKQRSYNACMRSKGLLHGGGVQPVQTQY